MRRKVGSKYKNGRGRTRRKVQQEVVEHEDSESELSFVDEDDEEFDIEDDGYSEEEFDDTDYHSDVVPRERRRQPKRTSNPKVKNNEQNNPERSRTNEFSEEDNDEDNEDNEEDTDDEASPNRRSTRRSVRVNRNSRSTKSGLDSGDDRTGGGSTKSKKVTASEKEARKNSTVYSRKQPATARHRATITQSLSFSDSDSGTDENKDDIENHRDQKNGKSTDGNTPRSTRSSSRRSTRLSSARRQQEGWGENVGDILGALPSPRSIGKRQKAVQAGSRSLTNEGTKHFDVDDDDNSVPTENDSANKEDSEYDDDDEETKVNNSLKKRSKNKVLERRTSSRTKKVKRRKAPHSSDEEFVLDSDDDNSSQDLSLSDDSDGNLMEDDNDILMIGDPDLSDDDSHPNNVKGNRKENKNAAHVVNIDNEKIGTVDDEDDDDAPSEHQKSGKNSPRMSGNEILPSPKGPKNDDCPSDQDTAAAKSRAKSCIGRQSRCPVCPSTEDAITLDPLSRLHVCYIVPDGKSRQCFNLETLRQIALKSSQLELRVDIDGERQNLLQPPAFRTPMSDDLVDQIASKFGRDALDLHGPYYKNRESKEHSKKDEYEYEYEHEYGSDSSGENIYDSLSYFRERMKDYFKKGMGSQDIYVCPLCYDQIHRSITKPKENDGDDDDDSDSDDGNENDTAPCDFNIDPMMVLGHLDNDEMYMASQFCFKKLADVKKHLREDHNVDTRGIQGNDLYKRYRVRAPDGLLQRWLSTQVRGPVKQGDMRIYWDDANTQTYIQLLDLIEQVHAYSEGADDDSSEDRGHHDELGENANRAQEFFGTFATRAPNRWKMISSPFLKSNENVNDFIANDNDSIEEISVGGGQPHAFLHHQFMNGGDSDENDFAHKLQRKYADVHDEETESRSSSTEDELVIEGDVNQESGDEDNEEDNQFVYSRNGYYSPVEEETDEWMLKLQSQRRRKGSQQKKMQITATEVNTPVGKRLFRRKTTPTGTSSSTSGVSKKRRKLTIEDSSDDEIL